MKLPPESYTLLSAEEKVKQILFYHSSAKFYASPELRIQTQNRPKEEATLTPADYNTCVHLSGGGT